MPTCNACIQQWPSGCLCGQTCLHWANLYYTQLLQLYEERLAHDFQSRAFTHSRQKSRYKCLSNTGLHGDMICFFWWWCPDHFSRLPFCDGLSLPTWSRIVCPLFELLSPLKFTRSRCARIEGFNRSGVFITLLSLRFPWRLCLWIFVVRLCMGCYLVCTWLQLVIVRSLICTICICMYISAQLNFTAEIQSLRLSTPSRVSSLCNQVCIKKVWQGLINISS